MGFLKTIGLSLFAIGLTATQSLATDCSHWQIGRSADRTLPPLSVPAAQIGRALSARDMNDGVQFKSWMKGGDLWLDITRYPGEVTAAVGPRSVMQAGRLAGPGFRRLVLADQGRGVFSIDEPNLRAIGCQFVWNQQGGQNPIALMRMLFQSMRYYESGQPLSNGFNGSLMGDTSLALGLSTKVFMPGWAMSAVQ